ncbi:hypothetical protein FA13DRAFT_794702 [Coprinellus micaceus]|uniref:Uncharacterized protein n=1 Tax=Coprinellus micaceus TaxID=71717 RepID=A0A4Y7T2W7_COPMI|nr:hypothetical protein FA13DRAFT_794702 [Coprinellus micaceus]
MRGLGVRSALNISMSTVLGTDLLPAGVLLFLIHRAASSAFQQLSSSTQWKRAQAYSRLTLPTYAPVVSMSSLRPPPAPTGAFDFERPQVTEFSMSPHIAHPSASCVTVIVRFFS